MAGLPSDLPWREVMATYAATVRKELLGHRDGAKAFSGTTLTDPAVIRRQEGTFENLIRQGFTLPDAVRGLLLLHNFTIGFCVEEQAVIQVTASGDVSYSLARRAELIGPDTAPLAVEAGQVIFGDPSSRFSELLDLLLAPSPGCGQAGDVPCGASVRCRARRPPSRPWPAMRRFAADLAAVAPLRVDPGDAADIIWATNAPELYRWLVSQRGWSPER